MKKMSCVFLSLALVLLLVGCGESWKSDSPKKVNDSEAPATEAGNQQTVFNVGDTVSISNIEVTFVSCEESRGSDFFKPSDGNVFLVCEFEIDNKSQSDIAVSSMLSFEAYVDDYSTSSSLTSTVSTDKEQLDGSVAAGKKMSGAIGYEVSDDWKELEIRFTPDFWSGEKITFVATH